MERIAHGVIDKLDNHFHSAAQAAGHTGRRFFRDAVEEPAEHDTETDRPRHGVHVNRRETHVGRFSATVCHDPRTAVTHNGAVVALITGRQLAIGQVGQVVDNVL